MNREEMNWLLQTIKDAKIEERFVLAQFERGRISLQVMADAAQERGWNNRATSQFLGAATRQSTDHATIE